MPVSNKVDKTKTNGKYKNYFSVYIAFIFLITHLIYYLSGVRFDTSPLNNSWQYIDPALLRDDLLKSCYYLHIQPPLFNMFLGIIVNLFTKNINMVFCFIYLAFGLVLSYSIFTLQIKLGVSKYLSLVLCTLFIASPSFILYENWLFYTFPAAMLVTLSALLLFSFVESHSYKAAFGLFVTIFILCGIRSLFHIFYFFFIVMFLIALDKTALKKIVIAALIPFLLLASIYCKNLILFGMFTTSSWMGMNLWTMSAGNMNPRHRANLVESGKISRLSLVDRFSSLEKYPEKYIHFEKYADIPVLRQPRKSTGATNYNHFAYIAISETYLKDASYVTFHFPKMYFIGIIRAFESYFRSSSDNPHLEINRSHLSFMDSLYNRIFYGQISWKPDNIRKLLGIETDRTLFVCIFFIVGFPFLLLYNLRYAIGGCKKSKPEKAQKITILYICLNIFFVASIGNLFEIGENNRFRFMTDPLYLILLGIFLQSFFFTRSENNSD